MKKIILPLVLAAALLPLTLIAQQSPVPPTPTNATLERFDLAFPGGRPDGLVKAIEKASNHNLNAIIPQELENEQLPALRMKSVNVPELFAALAVASQKRESQITGTYFNGQSGLANHQFQQMTTELGFKTRDQSLPDAIWVFYKVAPTASPDMQVVPDKICRFFQLGPYLETYKVEDITTAIDTGWQMLGDRDSGRPQISFHKDTKLLIAVGDPAKLKLIDSVLEQLNAKQPNLPSKPAKSEGQAK